MSEKTDWVGIANLAVNTAQLHKMNQVAGALSELQQAQLSKDQALDREARMRQVVFLCEQALKVITTKLHEGNLTYGRSMTMFVLGGLDEGGIKAAAFTQFADKERVQTLQDQMAKIHDDCNSKMSAQQREDADFCLKCLKESEDLKLLISLIRAAESHDTEIQRLDTEAKELKAKIAKHENKLLVRCVPVIIAAILFWFAWGAVGVFAVLFLGGAIVIRPLLADSTLVTLDEKRLREVEEEREEEAPDVCRIVALSEKLDVSEEMSYQELVELREEREARFDRIIEGNQPGPANSTTLNPTGQTRVLNAENPRTCAPGQCAQCGTINTGQDRFCAECGAGLYDSCPSCKVENRVGIKFCGQCGADLIQHRRRIDLRRNALDLATQASQLSPTAGVPLWRETIKTCNTLLAEFPGDSDGQATLKEAQAQLSSTLLRDAQELIDQALAMPAAPETARPLLNQAIAMLNQILVEIPDFEPARRAQAQAVDEERRKRAEIHAKHSEALQEASAQIQQGNHLTAQRLLSDADLYQKSYQEFSDLDYAKTNNDLATLQKVAGEVVSFAARLPGECEKLLKRFKESQGEFHHEQAKLELAALREEFNGHRTNVTTLSGSELELECRPHLDAARTELDRTELEVQSIAAAAEALKRRKAATFCLLMVFGIIVFIGTYRLAQRAARATSEAEIATEKAADKVRAEAGARAAAEKAAAEAEEAAKAKKEAEVAAKAKAEAEAKVAAAAKALADRRIEWTGAAMRRAGFQEDQVKRVLTQGGTVVAWGRKTSGPDTVIAGLNGVVAIAAGSDHTVALKQDGSVVSWGNNVWGQCTVPPGLSGVVAIAAGRFHTVALKIDGNVVAWGDNDKSQCTVPPNLGGVAAIAAGKNHTVALKQDGSVVAWGDNEKGQCTVPAGLSGVVAIAAGFFHTVALKSDGTVVAWGWESAGSPTGSSGVVAVAAGLVHTVALKSDGTVVAWGDNSNGQCTVPVGLRGVVAIAVGNYHTVALKQDGSVVSWGNNVWGQCTVPPGLSGVVAIAAGSDHTVALKLTERATSEAEIATEKAADKARAEAGARAAAEKAAAEAEEAAKAKKEVEAKVAAEAKAAAEKAAAEAKVAAEAKAEAEAQMAAETKPLTDKRIELTGAAMRRTGFPEYKIKHTLTQGGRVVAWGNNDGGISTVPAGMRGVVAITAGGSHTVALKNDGAVVAWGDNGYGQSTVPGGLGGVVAIAAGRYFTTALKSNGTVASWGENDHGQCTPPTGLSDVVAIAAGSAHAIALKQNGKVVAWGNNSNGQCRVPFGTHGVVAIAAGYSHTVALKQDGTVVAWGDNTYGQSTVPARLGAVVAIAAGYYHTVALKQDGTVVAWGENDNHQRNVPDGLSGVVAIAAGSQHTLALKRDGTVVAWGRNIFDQCNVPIGLTDVGAITAGENHTVALKLD